MTIIEVPLNHIACTGCIRRIKRGTQKFNGVKEVKILTGTGKLQIKFSEETIKSDEIHQRIHHLAHKTFD
ncbi:heavy-metal-associated domain-containing protein [Neobacillus kokaensis]|uniref:HMA domain-containing protein n=1 Tax=Neobacillus kokaensis TaxID=2759023 RepID=A0ABQ3N866_9BACI|nr:heavy-metal-associated domain-containing protein [Neobacillus kokaensis]GHI00247.1 hypothetical protein AM1BK_37890 [Neobacillus kokaensis]